MHTKDYIQHLHLLLEARFVNTETKHQRDLTRDVSAVEDVKKAKEQMRHGWCAKTKRKKGREDGLVVYFGLYV